MISENKKYKPLAILVVLLSIAYLVNPTLGIFEFIPDNIPGIGNLDETVVAGLLFAALRYLGLDILNLGKKSNKEIEQK
ncbi:MAG: DUF1232 domain-containing protein [Chitinophagales bacterium]|jgi:uncharacterized membrane protein YkvA (DUF1232 family)|nr:DUF1232 domain-containing protein [Chitinophagales bacterium]